MKAKLYLLILLTLSLALWGCEKAAPSDPPTTAASTQAPAESQPGSRLTRFTLDLPQGWERISLSDTQDSLLLDGKAAGGLFLLEVSEESTQGPFVSGELSAYLLDTVMPQIAPGDYDYIVDFRSFTDPNIPVATGSFLNHKEGVEYKHQVFQVGTYVVDLWINTSLVDFETEQALLDGVNLS